jgi:hypothetical protein
MTVSRIIRDKVTIKAKPGWSRLACVGPAYGGLVVFMGLKDVSSALNRLGNRAQGWAYSKCSKLYLQRKENSAALGLDRSGTDCWRPVHLLERDLK